MKTAKHWKLANNGQMECVLCPRHCRIAENKRGACFGRRRVGDELIAETYGLACALAVDPIEKIAKQNGLKNIHLGNVRITR